MLPVIEIDSSPNPTHSVIWLHGLGADGNDFVPIVPELRLPDSLSTRFIFPHAPAIPVTVNGGYVMPAWYDILEMDIDRKVDTRGLLESAGAIKQLLDRELERGVAEEHIVLAGFSQGGAVAYHLALSCGIRLAGLLAMSTYLATANIVEIQSTARELPILVQHGEWDPVVPEALARQAVARLEKEGCQVRYQWYPMEHAVCPEQINDISHWLQTVLK